MKNNTIPAQTFPIYLKQFVCASAMPLFATLRDMHKVVVSPRAIRIIQIKKVFLTMLWMLFM